MSSFADLGLEAPLCVALERAGISAPFPIQELTLVDALAGRDVCGKAPTGSGKTLAYGLAILQRVERAKPRRPRALVLVPTRELAGQVATALAPYGQARQRWVTAFFGGAGMMRQIGDLKRGVDVAVATPGRLTDLVQRGECDLSDVDLIVIDEADRMADMGFTPQVSWLLDLVNKERQILLFSATLDGDVDNLIKKYLKDPVHHEMSINGEDEDTSVLQRAKHFTSPTKNDTKFQDVAFIADASERTIVFVKNRFATERTAAALETLGVSALAMHGGMTQSARSKALQRWADGKVKVLVATDVAARGVHVDSVELVVHVDPPQDHKDYLHRSGRTARAGVSGVVVSLLRKEQRRSTAAMFTRLGVETTEATGDEIRATLAEMRVSNAEIRANDPLVRARATALGDWVSDTEEPYVDNRGSRGGGGYRGGQGGSRDGRSSGGRDRDGRRPAGRYEGRDSRGPSRDRDSRDARPRTTWTPEPSAFDRAVSDRPVFADRSASDRPAFADRGDRSDRGDRGDRGASRGAWQNDRPAFVRPDRDLRPGSDRPSSDRPFSDRSGSDRPAFARSDARSDLRPSGGYQGRSESRAPWSGGDRSSAPSRPWTNDRPREGGARPEGRGYQGRSTEGRGYDRPSEGRPSEGRGYEGRPSSGRGYEGRPTSPRSDAPGVRREWAGKSTSGAAWRDRPARNGAAPYRGRDNNERPAWNDRPARTDRPAWNDRPASGDRAARPAWNERPRFGDENRNVGTRGPATGRASGGAGRPGGSPRTWGDRNSAAPSSREGRDGGATKAWSGRPTARSGRPNR
jgi:superfamily II DNA/RNA helicase